MTASIEFHRVTHAAELEVGEVFNLRHGDGVLIGEVKILGAPSNSSVLGRRVPVEVRPPRLK